MNKDIAHIKKEMRRRVREAIANLDPAEKKRQSSNVTGQIEADERFRKASNVAVFWSMDDEVDIRDAVRKWSATKNIFLPVVTGDTMSFHRFSADEDLCRGELGTECPAGGEPVDPAQLDLVIVPGVAFDRSLNRMGRGKGFYDKFLKNTSAYKIGVCFAPQFVGSIPCMPHDVAMDKVIVASEQ